MLRGYDGGAYDFADQHRCNLMLTALGMKLYQDTSEAALRRLHLLSTAKCVHATVGGMFSINRAACEGAPLHPSLRL